MPQLFAQIFIRYGRLDMTSTVLNLDKIEAATRQLRMAIAMWFDEADPVPTHTLAFAAYEIFHSVSEHRNPYRRDLLFDSLIIKDEYRGVWNKHLRKEANFFKHGDRDPEESIKFDPDITEFYILFASLGRELCSEQASDEEWLFKWWIQIHRPLLLTEQGRKFLADNIPVDDLEQIRRLDKRQFRDTFYRTGPQKKYYPLRTA